jgi:hypothetical protein
MAKPMPASSTLSFWPHLSQVKRMSAMMGRLMGCFSINTFSFPSPYARKNVG